ncbi:hypothetical protein AXF42_Ash020245 [Apostasia shenzhenica]|uniref:Uncharacterized protein n=1 Tax=Apostasia shenzhenica TaxID=1088818 RepID=A0A2I0AVR8_9ASPA|nr:hypothetical protein AXF42_Ash020245 [Apostasia shenzhenica]
MSQPGHRPYLQSTETIQPVTDERLRGSDIAGLGRRRDSQSSLSMPFHQQSKGKLRKRGCEVKENNVSDLDKSETRRRTRIHSVRRLKH